MKKNLKAFTLVELVVVSCMMVIMMGAILNFIKPINNFYHRTFSTADSNDIGNIIMDYFESEVRYSTNMIVLEDYEGMPEVSGGYLMTSSGAKASTIKFTDVIIIDNNNNRGSVLSTYSATDTPAHRKRAKGSIIKANMTASGTIDLTNAKLAVGEETLSDYGCNFTARLSNTTKNKCLSIGMKLYSPEYNGSSYVFNKLDYDQTRDLELVNINIIKTPMKADYYTNAVDDSGNLYGTAIDYSTFTQASNPGGLSAGQNAFYDTTKKYTYIFYTKSVPTNSDRCKIKLLDRNGTTVLDTKTITTGSTIPQNVIDSWYANASFASYTTSDGSGNYYQHTLDKIETSTHKNISDYLTEGVSEDLEFVPSFISSLVASPKGFVYFYDCYDDAGNDLGAYTNLKNKVAYYEDNVTNSALGASSIVNCTMTGTGDEAHIFERWNTSPDGTGSDFVDGSSFAPAGDYEFYAIYRERAKYHVIFQDESGSEISNDEYYEGITNNANITIPADPSVPEGKVFVGWFEDGDKTKTALTAFTGLSYDITFRPVFEDIPESGAHLTVLSTSSNKQNWGRPVCYVEIKVKNVGTDASSGGETLTLTFNNSVDSFGSKWGDACGDLTASGNVVTVSISRSINPDNEGSICFFAMGSDSSDYNFDLVSASFD